MSGPDAGDARTDGLTSSAASERLTLDNCAREPIHRPGSIQPHGVLLAFDAAGTLRCWSANADERLGGAMALGLGAAALPLPAVVIAALAALPAPSTPGVAESGADGSAIDDTADGDGTDATRALEALPTAPQQLEARIGDDEVDVVMHAHAGHVLVELEWRADTSDAIARFALRAHGAIDRVRRQPSLQAMLERATEEVRALTGFDRVMAYRFRHDDSGDVVAEARDPALSPYLGMRYPASDIPAQARRLYTLNTLRLIADVGYRPVPLVGDAHLAGVLDLSHAVLRSVSPVHVEYLQNIGVQASMSVSIVVNGRLWGLLACHHRTPRLVPYSVRMACDVLAQVLAGAVQSIEARERADAANGLARLRSRVAESLLQEDDLLAGLAAHADALRSALSAEALVLVHQGKLQVHGPVPETVARALLRQLELERDVGLTPDDGELLQRTARDDWPPALQPVLGPWVGLLGLRFDAGPEGWLLALRREQIETVRWGNRKDPAIVGIGPLGPRLTPPGSFAEWRETVRGQAVPWGGPVLEAAHELQAVLARACNHRHAELERARTELLAILGHDLRDPLHTIHMAARVLEKGGPSARVGQRILSSSGRMQRLVSQVMDLSRLRSGLGLAITMTELDLVQLVLDLLDESRTAHPGVRYELDAPAGPLPVRGDADRLAQVLSNLLSNARHHGQAGHPVRLRVQPGAAGVTVEVSNVAPPIDPGLAAQLFSPFKRTAPSSGRSGLGLGLYIAHNIVSGHGGQLHYRAEMRDELPVVVFTVALPQPGAAAATASTVSPDPPDERPRTPT